MCRTDRTGGSPTTCSSARGGVVATPDVAAALAASRDRLALELVEDGPLDAGLAASWGAPALAGARTAALRPSSGAPCVIRLVEQAVPDGFGPTRTFGWAAYELTVQDVYGWPDRLADSGFEIVGPPKPIENLRVYSNAFRFRKDGENDG